MASRKNYMTISFMGVYGDAEGEKWFLEEWANTGKRLDMGKACIRFKALDNLPLELIGKAIERVPVRTLVERYEQALASRKQRAKR